MRSLPLPARLYVGATIVIGAVLVVWLGPRSTFASPSLFAALLLALGRDLGVQGQPAAGQERLDDVGVVRGRLRGLLLLGPNETMLVAVTSAWSQCTFRMKIKNPVYRTLFSMACLAITVQASGFAYAVARRHPRHARTRPRLAWRVRWSRRRRRTSSSTRCLIAVAVALATRQTVRDRCGIRTSCGARRAISSAPVPRPSRPGR